MRFFLVLVALGCAADGTSGKADETCDCPGADEFLRPQQAEYEGGQSYEVRVGDAWTAHYCLADVGGSVQHCRPLEGFESFDGMLCKDEVFYSGSCELDLTDWDPESTVIITWYE